MLTGATQFLALSILQLQNSSLERCALWFLRYFYILGKSQNLVPCIE
ncbi:hypothetical protein F383_29015 [Gossypium arboreum]|uniref:Uncharacterized protein n=1 Tax=Gossypium arboreum TaxID=29729 RepID=A0A0B0MYI7_GOSAR|nr:hypothetical protein F383_29015 [Gossypium arboreum]